MPSEVYSSEIDPNQSTRTQFEAARDGLDAAVAAIDVRTDDAEATISNLVADQAALAASADALGTKVAVSLDTDGTLKAGAVDVTGVIGAGVVTPTNINATVAGNGLAGGAGTALSVAVDGSTIEISADALRVRATGIAASHLNAAAITQPNLVWDAINANTDPRYEWGDKARWHANAALSLVTDATNPFGSKTLRFLGASASANTGKKLWFDDLGLQTGDTLSASVLAKAASGTWGLSIGWYTAAGVEVGTATDGANLTFSGSARTMVVTSGAAPATAAYALLYIRRTAGTVDLDIYAMWANKGAYLGSMPNPGLVDTYTRRGENIVWDPFNRDATPRENFGAFGPWHQPAALSIVTGVAANPYPGGRTLRFLGASVSSVTGKRIPLKDAGLQVGDTVSFAAIVNSAGPGSWSLRCVFQDATRTNVGSSVNGTTTAVTAVTLLKTPAATVPAGATTVLVYMSRPSGTTDLDIYAIWGSKNGMITATPAPSVLPLQVFQDVAELRTNQDTLGLFSLRDWRGAVAKAALAVSGVQPTILSLGDSWEDRNSIHTPFRVGIQARHGDGGPGWVDFFSTDANSAYNDGWTLTKAGTWTGQDAGATAAGLSLSHMSTTDIATPAKLTLASTGVINKIVLQYKKVVGGGTFRWRVDGGAWTTVDTDAAVGIGLVTISGLSSATHTIEAECTVAGSQGLTLIGASLTRSGNGAIVHKAGNASTKASEWVAVDAVLWEAGVAALAPNLVTILLGTNDKTLNVLPDTFATDLTTLIGRIRVAVPLADIMLMSPADSGDTATYLTQSYEAAMRSVAAANGCAYLSIYHHFGPNADAISRDLMDALGVGNSRHVTTNGGAVIANMKLRALRVD